MRRPFGDAWVRVRREMDDVASRTAAQVQRAWLDRASALLRYHVHVSRNQAYRELIEAAGLDPADVAQTAQAWSEVPVIDKRWLARAGYASQPACSGRTLVVSTGDSTATPMLVPVTRENANRGLGDNFLRALLLSGAGSGQRHWGVEQRAPGHSPGVTGSSISMAWLARHSGGNALVTTAADPLDEQLRRAAAFGPDTISGSPGFLLQLARSLDGPRPALLMYGGAALADGEAGRLRARFAQARLSAFYPTTEAGALGVSPAADGVYQVFTETHLVEVLDDEDRPVAVGGRGDVVVTQFEVRAAPIIRYRVGDRATFLGWDQGRLLLGGIERAARAPVRAQPQARAPVRAQTRPPVRAPVEAEVRDPPATTDDRWKIPLYVDEHAGPGRLEG
jgi:phenylacetate-coenzyme A ligase PaaK-like adenylate-forming protein